MNYFLVFIGLVGAIALFAIKFQTIDVLAQHQAEVAQLAEQLDFNFLFAARISLVLIIIAITAFCIAAFRTFRRQQLANQTLKSELQKKRDAMQKFQRLMASLLEDMQREKQIATQGMRANTLLAALVKDCAEAIISLDTAGHITSWNYAAQQLFASEAQTILDKQLVDIFPADECKILQDAFDACIGGNSIKLHEFLHRRSNDDIAYLEIQLSPIRIDNGTNNKAIMGISMVINDTTELRQSEQQLLNLNQVLAKKNQEMEQFIYTISHDLKAPLVTIDGFTHKLHQELTAQLSERQNHRFERITSNVKIMELMLNDLLNLSRIVTREIEKDWVNVAQVLQDVLNSLAGLIIQSNAQINISSELPAIYANERMIYQCLQNLISNAIKYGKPEQIPLVEISSQTTQQHIIFKIADNGIGIAQENLAKIFEIFIQLYPDQSEGMGVGLTIVKSIMEKHQGAVEVSSELGQGSEFRLLFPYKKRLPYKTRNT